MVDPTLGKHGGVQTSVEAFERARPLTGHHHRRILTLIDERGERGLTLKEYCEIEGVDKHQVSGRFSDLRNMGVIKQTDQRRDHCAAWVRTQPLQKQRLLFDVSKDAQSN